MRQVTLLLALAPSLSCGEGEPSGPPPPPPAAPPVPASVEVFPGALTLTAFGLNGTLSARVRDQRRRTLADVPLTWSSSAPAIATVDSAGRVTAVDNGKATIIASAGEASGEAVVTVAQQAATLELAPPDTVRTYGDTARVAARSSDVNGHAIPPTLLTWTSGDTRIVTVDSTGLVTATGNGTASVSAWSGPFRVSVDVTVYDLAEARKTDREVLMVLFNEGRSHVWPRKENWGTDAPLSTWAGVSTDEEGRVTALSLPENQIGGGAGGIPPELGKLDRLEILDLSRNSFSGVIPPELGSLERLTTLDLSLNRFIITPIPPEFGNLANLRSLNLKGIYIRGSLPAQLFGLTGLEVLRLRVRGAIPPELGKLSSLRVLHLAGSGGPGAGGIPPEFGDLANLEVLRLDGSRLSGGIPPELGKLVKLDTLNLYDTWLGGAVPPELGNLTNLRSLRLGNPVGFPPPPVWNAPPRPGYVWELLVTLAERGSRLEELYVDNGTGGPIPPEIAKLTQLKKLSWTHGGLPGPIPPEIGDLTNLEVLNLRENALTGPIPAELGNLAQLDTLILLGNHLAGPIPPEFGDLRELSTLVLSYNQLTGPIPPELGNLVELWWLFLLDNPLSGSVPATITRLTALQILDISKTEICVPTGSAFDAWLASVESFRGVRCPSPPQ